MKMGGCAYAWVTLVPLAWLAAATLTAGWQKVFSPDPRLGFLSHAQTLIGSANPQRRALIFNDRLDAALALFFMAIVLVVIVRIGARVVPRRVPAQGATARTKRHTSNPA